MKPSDVVEDVAVASGAISGSTYLFGHPTLAVIFGLLTAAATALAVKLQQQGS
jgi:hypothetical protein